MQHFRIIFSIQNTFHNSDSIRLILGRINKKILITRFICYYEHLLYKIHAVCLQQKN